MTFIEMVPNPESLCHSSGGHNRQKIDVNLEDWIGRMLQKQKTLPVIGYTIGAENITH